MSNYCPQAITQLAIIKTLQTKLGQELVSVNSASERSEKITQLSSIYQLRKALRQDIKQLENLVYPEYALAEKLNLKEQYDSQIKVLKDSGILRDLGEIKNPPTEAYGIIGVDDNEYLLPTYEDVLARLKDPEKKKLIEKKFEQGFVKLQIVPFAANISRIIECYKETLLRVHKESGILATDGTTLELNTEDPFYIWVDLIGCDKPNTPADKQMEYGVINYNGKTKKARRSKYKSELLQNPDNAWEFSLIEDLPDLPAENQGQTIANRKQFEANKTPKDYLNLLRGQNLQPGETNPYQGESGQTPESAFITWLTYLQEKKIGIDDYRGQGKANWFVGSWLSGEVPNFFWNRVVRQPNLSGNPPDSQDSYDSFRSSARF